MSARTAIAPVFLLLCLLLGGASAAGYMANMLLQLAAIAIIAWSLAVERKTPMPRPARTPLAMAAAILLLAALQLVPLPSGLWTALPGREAVRDGFDLLGLPLPWLPLSLAPDRTLASMLWLLPAFAMLIAILRPGAYKPELLAGSILAVTLAGIALGTMQRSGNAAAYFYRVTNIGMGTGFFANGNHMATLLTVSVPFLAALYLSARLRSRSTRHASGLLIMLAGGLSVLLAGIAINGSLAGLGLTVPVLCASALMLLSRDRRVPYWALIPLVLLTVGGVALVFTSPLGNDLTSAATTMEGHSIARQTFFANTLRAATDFAPFGSGIGSFSNVYPLYENPEIVTATYVNHAHSDLLELLLETGLPGMVLLLLFLLWWLRRTSLIWQSDATDPFARAATIATAAIMGHSLVDYPLRTAAVSAVFAACCALMAEPRPWTRPSRNWAQSGPRHLDAG